MLFLFNTINCEIPKCQKLWDMNNRINGIEIYKMGLYACIEGPTPNLRGSIPELIAPSNITILNASENLSKNINSNTSQEILNNSTKIDSTTTESISNTESITSTISYKNTITTTTTTTTTTDIPKIPETNTPRIDANSDTIIIDIDNSTNITTNKMSFNDTNLTNAYNQNIITEKITKQSNILNTTNIIIISCVASIICCGTLSFFVHKAHIKSLKKNINKEETKKQSKSDIESGEKLKSGQLANAVYYSNKLRNKLGNKNGKRMNIKNRNSWSRDNRIQPEKKQLPPKLPEPSIKVKINSYKTKKPGLSLNTKEVSTSVPTQKFQIREIVQHKKQSSFVPGSPRRRLPTPPQRAPPPPAPEFASKSLANKLDNLSNKKISPKIQRIVQKNK